MGTHRRGEGEGGKKGEDTRRRKIEDSKSRDIIRLIDSYSLLILYIIATFLLLFAWRNVT